MSEPLVIPHQPATVQTEAMGGVTVPSFEELLQMHSSHYILHARGGTLTRVSVDKTLLPADRGTAQAIDATKAPDGTVYIQRDEHVFKSTDGGRTWTAYVFDHPSGRFEILDDGTFVAVARGNHRDELPLKVIESTDEGRSWQKRSEFDIPDEYKPYFVKGAYGIHRLTDGTLICPVDVRMPLPDTKADATFIGDGSSDAKNGSTPMEQWTGLSFRSTNGGRSWSEHSVVCHWWAGAEGGIVSLPSGKALAVIRYQRPLLSDDPPDLVDRNGGYPGWPYKHVFLADSSDSGKSWQNFRQLCTRFGQTYGYPAVLSDGTVVVVHDTRYGPGGPGSRALISHDEGQTWQDEVYYLDYSAERGSYSASVVLDDGVILTIVASTKPAEKAWSPAHATAIRWQPVI